MVEKMYPAEAPVEQPPSDLDATTLLKVILDEDRLAVLGLVALRPHTFRELVDVLLDRRIPPARHVPQLVEAGLLKQTEDQSYVLNTAQVQQWKRELFARPQLPKPETLEEQVMATFVRAGQIIKYPVQHPKRMVLLHWLTTHFEFGRSYSEAEVNEILAGHSEDHATLRRYLVDHQLMARDHGIYTRVEG
jgi:hypothetical protein